MIAHTIQLALAPVFVLVAIGNLLTILSHRLGRIIDRARVLQEHHGDTEGAEHDALVLEIRTTDQRMKMDMDAIRLLVLSGLAIGTTVAMLFVEEMSGVPLEGLVAGLFLLAVALLMWALLLFLRESQIAAQSLRIPDSLKELHRQL